MSNIPASPVSHTTRPAIHVAISFDSGYVVFVYVFLASLFEHNQDVTVVVHALAPEVAEVEQQALRRFAQAQGGDLLFHQLDPSLTRDFALPAHEGAYLSIATYYRIFLANSVDPALQKLLYIDIDTLVVGSLRELYATDLGDYAIGAVREAEMPPRPELGITDMNNYFNAGVLLINLPQWQAQGITRKISDIAIAESGKTLEYADQDALNKLFNGNWYRLPERYNLMKAYIPADLPRRDYAAFLADKVIVHYNGPLKPWHRACEHKFRYLYPHYLKRSPKAGAPRFVPRKLTRDGWLRLAYARSLEFYFNHPAVGRAWRRVKLALG